ncbi:hypothetical protein SHJG_7380 [Streptomyces hygroscopicus subsp. jinggangensis 5008]|nr:hypothetical protein SHJG_7380 [Streptomyces hygroscopicus subsp. jinggangensis 5008]AGF66802.1 hypothetical protein SHJGH_7140 [Streptomyces hygroscopicus subsp. jinggangensis TL01]
MIHCLRYPSARYAPPPTTYRRSPTAGGGWCAADAEGSVSTGRAVQRSPRWGSDRQRGLPDHPEWRGPAPSGGPGPLRAGPGRGTRCEQVAAQVLDQCGRRAAGPAGDALGQRMEGAGGVAGVDHVVGVQQQGVSGVEGHGVLGVRVGRDEADAQGRGRVGGDRPGLLARPQEQGWRVPAVRRARGSSAGRSRRRAVMKCPPVSSSVAEKSVR